MIVSLSELGKPSEPFRWSAERFLLAVERGVIEEGRGCELIDGAILTDLPQGTPHFVVSMALQRAFDRLRLAARGLYVGPTVVLSERDVFDPEFALLHPAHDPRELPRAEDVLLAIEVAFSSRAIDLGPKRDAYARAAIPHCWAFDVAHRGVWTFSDPVDGEYRRAVFVPAPETISVPVLNAPLDLGAIFPPEETPLPSGGEGQG